MNLLIFNSIAVFGGQSMLKILRIFLRMIAILIGIILVAWIIAAQFIFKFRGSDKEADGMFKSAGVHAKFKDMSLPSGRKIHYVMTGNDSLPTIYFIHGSPGSWDAFEGYLADSALLQKFRMVSIDRPGFGYSDFGEAENLITQSKMVSPLFKILANGKPNYVVGHSLGGPLIIKLASDNPGTFSTLVMLAGSVDPSLEDKERWRIPLMYFPLKFVVPGAMRPSNIELWYLKHDLVELKNDFSKVTCAVIIIHGDRDDMVPYANAEYAKSRLVNSSSVQLITLKGANHFIPWQHDNEIKDVLRKLP